MREIVLRRALDPTDRVERLVQRHPSLAMETLHAGLSAGRLVTLQRWQGSRAALAALSGVGEPVGKAREAKVLHVVERAGGRPSPLPIAEAQLGPYTAARATLDREGMTWILATPHDARAPAFLAALREAEDAFEKAQGAAIPRFAEHRAPPPSAGLLTPRERTVLAQARKAGYYDQPRKAGIAQVGAALKMPASTALYHLRAAQRKLIDDYLRR